MQPFEGWQPFLVPNWNHKYLLLFSSYLLSFALKDRLYLELRYSFSIFSGPQRFQLRSSSLHKKKEIVMSNHTHFFWATPEVNWWKTIQLKFSQSTVIDIKNQTKIADRFVLLKFFIFCHRIPKISIK